MSEAEKRNLGFFVGQYVAGTNFANNHVTEGYEDKTISPDRQLLFRGHSVNGAATRHRGQQCQAQGRPNSRR
jgi:hypothetical protein